MVCARTRKEASVHTHTQHTHLTHTRITHTHKIHTHYTCITHNTHTIHTHTISFSFSEQCYENDFYYPSLRSVEIGTLEKKWLAKDSTAETRSNWHSNSDF